KNLSYTVISLPPKLCTYPPTPCAINVVSQKSGKYLTPSAIYLIKLLSPPRIPPAYSTDRDVVEPSVGKNASSLVSLLSVPLKLLVVVLPSCSLMSSDAPDDTSFTVTSSSLYVRYPLVSLSDT